tara:strand:+ start:4344 stop:4901 length:558 start_codon:yes stop_codon:yes gene_type:complete
MARQLEVRCRRESYVRAGLRFKRGLNTLPLEGVTKEQITILEGDPTLEVSIRDLDPEAQSAPVLVDGSEGGGKAQAAPSNSIPPESETAGAKAPQPGQAGGTEVSPADTTDRDQKLETASLTVTGLKLKFMGDAWQRDAKKAVADAYGLTSEDVSIEPEGEHAATLSWQVDGEPVTMRVAPEASD